MPVERAVSVIIPVHDSERSLRACLDSLCAQTLRDIEIICVDDGSGDSSRDIIGEYSARDSRISLICQRNSGAGAARNRGLQAACGKYVVFLDSDDVFEVAMLELMYRRLESASAD